MTNTEKENVFAIDSLGKSHQVIGSQTKQPSLTTPIHKLRNSSIPSHLDPSQPIVPPHQAGLSILGLH